MSDSPQDSVRRYSPKATGAIALSELLAKQAPAEAPAKPEESPAADDGKPVEFGGRKNGIDPTRYGDWEKDGRCIDF